MHKVNICTYSIYICTVHTYIYMHIYIHIHKCIYMYTYVYLAGKVSKVFCWVLLRRSGGMKQVAHRQQHQTKMGKKAKLPFLYSSNTVQ